jgi:tRNA U55 pseudouridine synthase TruB
VLGVGAHLTALTRTRSGAFRLVDAISLDYLATLTDWSGVMVNLRDGLGNHWPVVTLADAALDDVLHGRAVDGADEQPNGTLGLGIVALDETLQAVLYADGGRWHPKKVFTNNES